MTSPARRAVLVLVACVASLASCASIGDDETVFLPDRERWVLANEQDDGHQKLLEYVPQGQSVDAWRELITVQRLDDRLPKRTPLETMKLLEAQMRTRGGELAWKTIEQDERNVIYEWTLRGVPGIEPQGEIARIVQGNDAVHRVAYSFKGLPLVSDRRADRLSLLRRAKVVKGEEEYWAAVDELMPEARGPH